MNMREYQVWLCEKQWNGYPLKHILGHALDTIAQERAYNALRSLMILSNGLGGESGEATEHFKKWVRDGAINKYEAGIELGDTLNYLIWLAATLGYTLEDLAVMSKAKLTARGPVGGS